MGSHGADIGPRALAGAGQAWFSRRPVYVAALSLMLGLCLGSILYPARIIHDLTNLSAPPIPISP